MPALLFDKMLRECTKDPYCETGGILIGRYSVDLRTATLADITQPPSDSWRTITRFHRGVRGLASMLLRRWREGDYYLGEWHYHPYSPPSPSHDDVTQMRSIANDPRYSCPNPILLIMGGDPGGEWEISVSVYASDQTRLIALEEHLW